MSQELLPCVELGPQDNPAATVIWLHGLGADGHDFVPIVQELGLPGVDGVRFVFPHAPSMPITINGGMVMPAWYDIEEVDLKRKHDMKGVETSALALTALMERELVRGVPPERLLLVGFSQGGAMALHVGRMAGHPLAGIVGLSTYMVSEEAPPRKTSEARDPVPIFLGHGVFDPMVPLARGQAGRARLGELGHDVQWHEYPMEHEVCLEEIRDLGTWMSARLGLSDG
ncbi:MAG: phospholipase/carboxylesterase [Pseudohongiellaceae bacterium]|jgi:phospholipase/carboxylesterase